MTPIYILSGQSNAVSVNGVGSFRKQILATEPDAIVIEYAVGGTAMYPGTPVDWYAGNDGQANTGELFSGLVTQIVNALEKHPDAYIAGMGWIQGESDAIAGKGLEYAGYLGLMADRLTEIFGEFPLAVLALSDNAAAATYATSTTGWKQVQEGQMEVDTDRESVTLLDPDVIAQEAGIPASLMFVDWVHYSGQMLFKLGPVMADHLLAIDAANGVETPTQINYEQIERIYSPRNGTAGADKIAGYTVNDMISGRAGNDTIDGAAGHDRLFGEEGDDSLTGGIGNDVLTGGAGSDSFVFSGNSGKDVIADFDVAKDILKLSDIGTVEDIDQSSNADGDLVLSWNYAGAVQSVTLKGLTQADFNDIDFGPDMVRPVEPEDNPELGTAASETHYGTGQKDVFSAQGGDDRIYGDDGDDHLSGDDGNDVIYGDNGDDSLMGGDGKDAIWGGSGNNVLDGGAGADFLIGGDGTDRLLGGSGNDTLAGGAGADNYVFDAVSGHDTIRQFSLAQDMLTIEAVSSAEQITKSSDSKGNLVLSWEYEGEAQNLTMSKLTLADFDSISFAFEM